MKLLDNEVEVLVERKKIKNIYMRIDNDGNVLVRVPLLTPNFEINRLINKNIDALEKMYKKYLKEHSKEDKIYFIGKELEYAYDKKIHLEKNIAYGPSIEKINNFLEKNSLPIFEKRMNLLVVTYDNIPKFRLRVRKMKTRWGVCNIKSMTITLNTLLIHHSIDAIDYVICHELSHFHHMDHSKQFWADVAKHYPNYKKARKELKD